MSGRTRLGKPLALIGVCAAAAIASDHTAAATGIWLRAVAGALAVAAAVYGALRFRARPLRPWLLLAAGLALWVIGDTVWDLLDLHNYSADSAWYLLPNVIYVITYPALIAAVIELVAARGERAHVSRVIDSFIPALMLLLIVRAFLLDGHYTGSTSQDVFTALFPLCDALLIAGVAWLVYASGLRNPATWLLTLGLGTLLAADILWDLYLRFGSAALSGVVGPIYPISYAIIAASALHPDVARMTESAPARRTDDSVPRVVMLCAALTLLPVVAFRASPKDILLVIGAGTLVLALTVRFAQLVRHVRIGRDLAELNAEQFANLLGAAPVGIFAADPDMTIIFANQATNHLLGKAAVGLTSRQLVELCVDRRDQPLIKEALATMRAGRPASTQVRIWRPDGTQRWIAWSGAPVGHGSGRFTGAFVTTIDITPQKTAEQALAQQLTHDPLTGLANGRTLIERIQVALLRLGRHSRGVAVLLIDLDRFKAVNDSYGHEAGDEILGIVAKRLLHCVRADDLVARYGADQFVIVLEHLEYPGDATIVAGKIINAISAPISLDRNVPAARIAASVGIATTADRETDADELVQQAAETMHEAKSAGGQQYRLHTNLGMPETLRSNPGF